MTKITETPEHYKVTNDEETYGLLVAKVNPGKYKNKQIITVEDHLKRAIKIVSKYD